MLLKSIFFSFFFVKLFLKFSPFLKSVLNVFLLLCSNSLLFFSDLIILYVSLCQRSVIFFCCNYTSSWTHLYCNSSFSFLYHQLFPLETPLLLVFFFSLANKCFRKIITITSTSIISIVDGWTDVPLALVLEHSLIGVFLKCIKIEIVME